MTGADGPDSAENRCTSGNCGGMDGSSTDGLCFTKRVVYGWPVGRLWPVVVCGWPVGRLRMARGSSADGQHVSQEGVVPKKGSSTDGHRVVYG